MAAVRFHSDTSMVESGRPHGDDSACVNNTSKSVGAPPVTTRIGSISADVQVSSRISDTSVSVQKGQLHLNLSVPLLHAIGVPLPVSSCWSSYCTCIIKLVLSIVGMSDCLFVSKIGMYG